MWDYRIKVDPWQVFGTIELEIVGTDIVVEHIWAACVDAPQPSNLQAIPSTRSMRSFSGAAHLHCTSKAIFGGRHCLIRKWTYCSNVLDMNEGPTRVAVKLELDNTPQACTRQPGTQWRWLPLLRMSPSLSRPQDDQQFDIDGTGIPTDGFAVIRCVGLEPVESDCKLGVRALSMLRSGLRHSLSFCTPPSTLTVLQALHAWSLAAFTCASVACCRSSTMC
jgi:hypothetical protein